jgi:hypothetical protein
MAVNMAVGSANVTDNVSSRGHLVGIHMSLHFCYFSILSSESLKLSFEGKTTLCPTDKKASEFPNPSDKCPNRRHQYFSRMFSASASLKLGLI